MIALVVFLLFAAAAIVRVVWDCVKPLPGARPTAKSLRQSSGEG